MGASTGSEVAPEVTKLVDEPADGVTDPVEGRRAAYVMSMLLSIALDLLRARSTHWMDTAPLTDRAAVVNDLTLTPRKLFRRVS